MLGMPRPVTRHSTALATEADQATPDFRKLYDDTEDRVDMDGKGCMWRVLKDDSIARIIANTLYSKYLKKVGAENLQTLTPSQPQTRESLQDKYRTLLQIKKRLRVMIGKKSRKRKSLDGIRLVYFVDTGGQPQFQEILPNFIKCDINLLVHNLSQDLHYCPEFNYVTNGKKFSVPEEMKLSNLDIIEQSVRSITSNARPGTKPSIALVGTFKDKCDPISFQETLKEKSEVINGRLEPYISGRGKCEIFSPNRSADQRIFAIDGSLSGWDSNADSLDKLKHFITEYATKSSIDVPIKYYIFVEILKAHATKEKRQYLTLKECIEIALTSKISMSEFDVVKALNLFDGCNVILYFPNVLKSVVFIKPSFLFSLVTDLIVASFQCESDTLPQERLYFQRTGIFSRSILQDIPSLMLTGDFTQQGFLNLMKDLFIIAEIPNLDCYFMPCVLPLEESYTLSSQLKECVEAMKENCIDGPLTISFALGISPRGLFCAILVALLQNPSWKLSTLYNGTCRCRNLIEFDIYQHGEHHACIGRVFIFDKGSKLEVYTTCDRDTCSSIRHTVYTAFEKASKSLGYESTFDCFGLPCQICKPLLEAKEHSTNIYRSKDQIWKEKCLVERKYPVKLKPNRLCWFKDDLHEGKFL